METTNTIASFQKFDNRLFVTKFFSNQRLNNFIHGKTNFELFASSSILESERCSLAIQSPDFYFSITEGFVTNFKTFYRGMILTYDQILIRERKHRLVRFIFLQVWF